MQANAPYLDQLPGSRLIATRFFIGVDPGVTGALAVLDRVNGELHYARALPAVKTKVGSRTRTRLQLEQIRQVCEWPLITGDAPLAWIERVAAMPKQGVASVFTFGQAYGQVHGLLVGLGIRVELVTPQSWQKQVGLARGATKDQHRARASEVFPKSAGLFMPKGAHNIADAALIAYAATLENGT